MPLIYKILAGLQDIYAVEEEQSSLLGLKAKGKSISRNCLFTLLAEWPAFLDHI